MIYGTKAVAKTGESIPLFLDGTCMHSKYDPAREANSFGSELASDSGCIVVGGIGGGFHLVSLRAKFPHSLIIAFEADETSLSFCRTFDEVHHFESQENSVCCTAATLPNVLLTRYLPALYGSFAFIPQRSWFDKNKELVEHTKTTIQSLLKTISADYSVQSHFGKLWQRNILLNLAQLDELQREEGKTTTPFKPSLGKKAAVIAAGPSLDDSINELISQRDMYVVFATDTSYGSLLLKGVIPDAVLSIDGQLVSATHFYICPNTLKAPASTSIEPTHFFFDLCASPAAARFVHDKGYPVHFLQSGHPLALRAASSTVRKITAGSGTVTIAACDLARELGFSIISLFGADFSYNSNKPYTKGTYLDKNFNIQATRYSSAESAFDSLMFRTPLTHNSNETCFSGTLKNVCTTETLISYEQALIHWAHENNFTIKANELIATCTPCKQQIKPVSFSYHQFVSSWLEEINNLLTASSIELLQNDTLKTLLPYIAWLRKQHEGSTDISLFELIKLAYSDAVRYN